MRGEETNEDNQLESSHMIECMEERRYGGGMVNIRKVEIMGGVVIR